MATCGLLNTIPWKVSPGSDSADEHRGAAYKNLSAQPDGSGKWDEAPYLVDENGVSCHFVVSGAYRHDSVLTFCIANRVAAPGATDTRTRLDAAYVGQWKRLAMSYASFLTSGSTG